MVIAVPVIVRIAVRAAPVFGAMANCTLPFPVPEAPCVTVRNAALLVAVHAHVLGVVTEIDAEPPDAGNVVVVTPVMIWQPVGPVVELELLSLQAAAERTRAKAEQHGERASRKMAGDHAENALHRSLQSWQLNSSSRPEAGHYTDVRLLKFR